MYEIELKTTKIDYLELINLTLDRNDWGKTFNISVYGDVIITITMKSFEFAENEAVFRIQCNYDGAFSDKWYNTDLVIHNLHHFKVEDFERRLNRKIRELVKRLIDKEKREFAHKEYNDIHFYSHNIEDEQIESSEYAKDYNIAMSLSGCLGDEVISDIRDKICYNLNRPFRTKVGEFVETYKLQNTQLENYYDLIKEEDS